MLALKILSPISIFGVFILNLIIDHYWRDKRTKRYKLTRKALIIVMILFTIVSVILIVESDSDLNELHKKIDPFIEIAQNKFPNKNIDNALKKLPNEFNMLNAKLMEAKNERANLKVEINSLESKLDPFIKLALNKYPNISIEEALEKLAGEIEILKKQSAELAKADKQIATQNIYRPLIDHLRGDIISRLKSLGQKYKNYNILITVSYEAASRSRQLIAKDLTEILNSAKIVTKGPNSQQTFFSSKGEPPKVRISCRAEDESLAQDLFNILKDFIKSDFAGKACKECEKGKLTISIYGEPIFLPDGTLTLH